MRGSRSTDHLLHESRQPYSPIAGDPASEPCGTNVGEAAGLDILLAEGQIIHVITAGFQRPPTSREISGVDCGELYIP